MGEIFRLAWRRFGIIAKNLGNIQGRAIATGFYYSVLVPFGLIAVYVTKDALDRKSAPSWHTREPVDNRLEGAKRQG